MLHGRCRCRPGSSTPRLTSNSVCQSAKLSFSWSLLSRGADPSFRRPTILLRLLVEATSLQALGHAGQVECVGAAQGAR